MLLDLRDPYGLGRDQTITVDPAARAALAECRATAGHRQRWQGEWRACADHSQDARLADFRLTMADVRLTMADR